MIVFETNTDYTSWTIKKMQQELERQNIDLSPTYQRNDVWSILVKQGNDSTKSVFKKK